MAKNSKGKAIKRAKGYLEKKGIIGVAKRDPKTGHYPSPNGKGM